MMYVVGGRLGSSDKDRLQAWGGGRLLAVWEGPRLFRKYREGAAL